MFGLSTGDKPRGLGERSFTKRQGAALEQGPLTPLKDLILELDLPDSIGTRKSTLRVFRRSAVEFRLVTTTADSAHPQHEETDLMVNTNVIQVIPAYATPSGNHTSHKLLLCDKNNMQDLRWLHLRSAEDVENLQQALIGYRVHHSVNNVSWCINSLNEPEKSGEATLQLWQLPSLQTSSESSNVTHQQKNLSLTSLKSSVSGTREMSRYSPAIKDINTVSSGSSAIPGIIGSRRNDTAVPQPEPPVMVLFIVHEGKYSFLHLKLEEHIFVISERSNTVKLEAKKGIDLRQYHASQKSGESLYTWDLARFRSPRHPEYKDVEVLRKVEYLTLRFGTVEERDEFCMELKILECRVQTPDFYAESATIDNMEYISRYLDEHLHHQISSRSVSLDIRWDLAHFMESQYVGIGKPMLGSVITLTGSVRCAQATTCSDYVMNTWPRQGTKVIALLERAISDTRNKASCYELDVIASFCYDSFQLTAFPRTKQTVTELFQQVIWMAAALRVAEAENVQHSNFKLTNFGLSRFSAEFETSDLPESERRCWVPLFANPVIAQGFPVPRRENEEQGLEIPLEMMAALGGARHLTEFEGGLVLKGQSAIFVPTKSCGSSIQWHFLPGNGDDRMPYQELRTQSIRRTPLSEVNFESARSARTFLGWWKCAETHLGTADAAYGDIDWSSTGEARRSIRFSGTELGLQNVFTGKVNFVLGAKDGRFHFERGGPFQKIVNCAENTPVALYDVSDGRAWLVPALDVMLHIFQTQHHARSYNVGGKAVHIVSADPTESNRCTARDAVIQNESRKLYEDHTADGKDYTFKDTIIDIWSQMERLRVKDDLIESSPGILLHGTLRSKLHGWEYMSLVQEKNYRRKEVNIAKSSGGWVDLIDDIDCLVLFGTGFQDIIRPSSTSDMLCDRWRTLPKNKDYLAAGVPMLELLYAEAGSRISRKHLSTNHLQWHRGSSLFEPCTGKSLSRCDCDRTQQIYHDSLFKTFGQVKPPGKLEEEGCVIFGQAQHAFKSHKPIPVRENIVHMLPNTPLQDLKISPPNPTTMKARNQSLSASGLTKANGNMHLDSVREEIASNPTFSLLNQGAHSSTSGTQAPQRRRKMSHAAVLDCEDNQNTNSYTDVADNVTSGAVIESSPIEHHITFRARRQIQDAGLRAEANCI